MEHYVGKIIIPFILLFSMTAVNAEDKTMWTVEYLPSDDYKSVVGFGVYDIKDESYGYYGNMHVSITANKPHYDFLNVNSFGDPVTDRYEELLMFDFGFTKKITTSLNGYFGIGFASVEGYAEKYDSTFIFSVDGKYYVPDTANDHTGGNINVGLLFEVGVVSLNLGYHSFTRRAYFGLGGNF